MVNIKRAKMAIFGQKMPEMTFLVVFFCISDRQESGPRPPGFSGVRNQVKNRPFWAFFYHKSRFSAFHFHQIGHYDDSRPLCIPKYSSNRSSLRNNNNNNNNKQLISSLSLLPFFLIGQQIVAK